MIIFRYLVYILACQLFIFRLLFYYVHSAVVFISKPGARLVIPLIAIVAIYLARPLIELYFGAMLDAIWRGAVKALVGSELFELTYPFRLFISAALMLVLLFVVVAFVSSMLRPIVGTFAAPKRPLPPLEPMVVPDTTVKTVKAQIDIAERKRNRFSGDLPELIDRLPAHLQHVVRN